MFDAQKQLEDSELKEERKNAKKPSYPIRTRNRSNQVLPPERHTCEDYHTHFDKSLQKTHLADINLSSFDNKRAGSYVKPPNLDLFPRSTQNVSENATKF